MVHDVVTMFEYAAKYGTQRYEQRPVEVDALPCCVCLGWTAHDEDLIEQAELIRSMGRRLCRIH